ncbi:MAG: MMPL family transporter [Nanoarchaeota archaeon]|nr:MMPL family transporter [Nanoarchaeota archaeon]
MKVETKQNIIDILLNWRTILLILLILVSIVGINTNIFSQDKVIISSVSNQQELFRQGFSVDGINLQRNFPTLDEINGVRVNSLPQAFELFNEQTINSTNTIIIDGNSYTYRYNPGPNNLSVVDFLGISIQEAFGSNIRLGIDLSGGTRVILEAKEDLTPEQFEELREILENRLNVFGASGATVGIITDQFSGDQFLFIESPSANRDAIFELIERQGNFEARLGNRSVFTGEDVREVLQGSQFTQINCNNFAPYQCSISFTVRISSQAANNMLQEASTLDIINGYLSEELVFILDGVEQQSLRVASTFKFQPVLAPQITLSGDPQDSLEFARKSAMHQQEIMKAILLTKPLPSELEVIQSFTQSAELSEEFLRNALIVGLLAIVIVALSISYRYKNPVIFLLISIALLSELVLIFGASILFQIAIDLAAIGGLIAAIGTGVDDQIIITDEYMKKKNQNKMSSKRIKNAMTIILIAFATTLAAIGPLFFAGLSILQGFAFMIILGVTIGVFITRPFYAVALRIITTTRAQREEEKELIEEEEKNQR